ncbi:MAG: RNA polymerase sigma factor [Candidatus Dormibacteria bacterium]
MNPEREGGAVSLGSRWSEDHWALVEAQDDEALAKVEFIGKDGRRREGIYTLKQVLQLATIGSKLKRVSAPDQGFLSWDASAYLKTRDWHQSRSGVLAPGGLWVLRAGDGRGFVIPLVQPIPARHTERSGGTRTIGKRMLDEYLGSGIEGLRARRRRSYEQLGPEETLQILATAALEERVGEAEFVLVYASLADRRIRLVVGHLSPARGQPERGGRRAIEGRFLKEMEGSAFGTGLDSPRSVRQKVPLDDEENPELATEQRFETQVEAAIDLAKLRERAGLTPREAAVLSLKLEDPDKTAQEIADRLAMSPSTVAVHWHNAKEKLRQA